MRAWGAGRGRRVNCRPLAARVAAQSSDCIQQLQPMPDCRDAKLLQGLVRQARKDRLVYLILAECRLILPEAQAPRQTTMSITIALNHGWRPSSSGIR